METILRNKNGQFINGFKRPKEWNLNLRGNFKGGKIKLICLNWGGNLKYGLIN
jgi:hypothetical protein